MSSHAMCPKPLLMPPPGTFSAPREVPLTLVAPGSQIYEDEFGVWRTVLAIGRCFTPSHGPMCAVFRVADGWLHLMLSSEQWVRHPIGGAP